MSEKLKHLDEIESFCKTEYALLKDIHYRKGEILKLEYINAKHCREIERLNKEMAEDDKRAYPISSPDLFHYLKALLIELSHKEGNAPINPDDIDAKYIEAASRYCFPVLFDKYAILDQDDTTKIKIQFAEHILRQFGLVDMYKYENLHTRGEIDLVFVDHRGDAVQKDPRSRLSEDKIDSGDKIDHITECKDLFEYIKALIIILSEKEGNQSVDPSVIDAKYIEGAVRYTMPGLFNTYALIGDNDRHKIELADSILHKFGIETMAKYEELVERGDIDIDMLDHRSPHPPKGL